MAKDITVDKAKFDKLLKKMVTTEPLPKSKVRTKKVRKADK